LWETIFPGWNEFCIRFTTNVTTIPFYLADPFWTVLLKDYGDVGEFGPLRK